MSRNLRSKFRSMMRKRTSSLRSFKSCRILHLSFSRSKKLKTFWQTPRVYLFKLSNKSLKKLKLELLPKKLKFLNLSKMTKKNNLSKMTKKNK